MPPSVSQKGADPLLKFVEISDTVRIHQTYHVLIILYLIVLYFHHLHQQQQQPLMFRRLTAYQALC